MMNIVVVVVHRGCKEVLEGFAPETICLEDKKKDDDDYVYSFCRTSNQIYKLKSTPQTS